MRNGGLCFGVAIAAVIFLFFLFCAKYEMQSQVVVWFVDPDHIISVRFLLFKNLNEFSSAQFVFVLEIAGLYVQYLLSRNNVFRATEILKLYPIIWFPHDKYVTFSNIGIVGTHLYSMILKVKK